MSGTISRPNRQVCLFEGDLERHLRRQDYLGRGAPSRHKSLGPAANIGYVLRLRNKRLIKGGKRPIEVEAAQSKAHQGVQHKAHSNTDRSEYRRKGINASLAQL